GLDLVLNACSEPAKQRELERVIHVLAGSSLDVDVAEPVDRPLAQARLEEVDIEVAAQVQAMVADIGHEQSGVLSELISDTQVRLVAIDIRLFPRKSRDNRQWSKPLREAAINGV